MMNKVTHVIQKYSQAQKKGRETGDTGRFRHLPLVLRPNIIEFLTAHGIFMPEKLSSLRKVSKVNWIGGSIALSVVLFLASCGGKADQGKQRGAMPDLPVESYRVTPKPFSTTVVVTAELQANEQVQLMAPMAGQVLEIYFSEGEKVAEGQPIVKLDDRGWKAQLIGLRAELDAATKDLDRKKALLPIEGSTQEEIDGVVSKIETLRSQIQQLEINIDLANVKAPFAGTLGLRNFSKGAYLKAGDVITVVTQLNKLKVDFALAQEYSSSMHVGKVVKVVVQGDTLQAKVYAINPLIDPSSRTIGVRAMLHQAEKNTLMPGTFSEVLVSTDKVDDALLVPTQAIVPEINDQTVFLYKNGKAERKTVQLGGRTDELVHISSGIHAGDTIITTGLLKIKTGMSITLQSVAQ